MNTTLETSDEWAVADGLADAIVALVNAELARMEAAHHIDAEQLISGLVLAFLAVMRTLPPNAPAPLGRLTDAAWLALAEMRVHRLAHPRT